jgi:hypothetical protein
VSVSDNNTCPTQTQLIWKVYVLHRLWTTSFICLLINSTWEFAKLEENILHCLIMSPNLKLSILLSLKLLTTLLESDSKITLLRYPHQGVSTALSLQEQIAVDDHPEYTPLYQPYHAILKNTSQHYISNLNFLKQTSSKHYFLRLDWVEVVFHSHL